MRWIGTLLIGLALLTAGCAKETASESFFRPADELSSVTRVVDVQAENGARADATLYPVHFDGLELNELGKQKLTAMFAGGKPVPVVYVDTPGKAQDSRLQHVRDAVKEIESQPEPAVVMAGPNPNTLHPSDGALRALTKTEAGGQKAAAALPTEQQPPASSGARTPPVP